jgi:hypothetical protein
VWAHPLPGGEPLRVGFGGVPIGHRIVGYTATDYVVGRHLAGGPVDLAIEVDGVVRHRLTHRDADGWRRFEVTSGGRAGGRADVAFVVSAPRHEGRHFCFAAQIREPR